MIERALALLPHSSTARETELAPVYLHIANERITLLAPREYWICAADDLGEITAEFGTANVKLVHA